MESETKNKLWRIKGINDEQDSCDCCGKKNLKKVVWRENTETLEIVALGTTCAARRQKITVKEQKTDEKSFIECCKKEAFEEMKPFTHRKMLAMAKAPNHLENKAYTLKDRLEWRANNEHIQEYNAKRNELNERGGFKVVL